MPQPKRGFGTYFIISPGGNLGVREILYGLLGAQMGIGETEGILASVTIRVLSFLTLIVLGVSFGGIGLLRNPSGPEDEEAPDD